MLYRGSEVMREVAWVIFDEIHYMRDSGMFCCVVMCVPCVFLTKGIKNLLWKSFWVGEHGESQGGRA